MRVAVVAVVGWALAACYGVTGPTTPAVAPRQPESAFAREIRTALATCDIPALEQLFDIDALATRAAELRPETVTRDGARGAIGRRGIVANVVCEDESDRATYTFLRDRMLGRTREITLRVVLASGNFNYLTFSVRETRGTVRIVDVAYTYSGETMSGLFAAWLGAPADVDDNFWRDLDLADERHDADAARALIANLPAAARAWRKVIRREIRIARDEAVIADLEEATARYAATFHPSAPLEIMSIDIAWANKRYANVVELVDQLDRRVGGDPYLDSIRADAYRHTGDYAKAVALAKRAADGDPSVESSWWMLATAQTAAHDFRGAIKTLLLLQERFDADVSRSTLRGDDRFTDLVLSWEYKRSSLRGPEPEPDDP